LEERNDESVRKKTKSQNIPSTHSYTPSQRPYLIKNKKDKEKKLKKQQQKSDFITRENFLSFQRV
jgi:hypothetical protein